MVSAAWQYALLDLSRSSLYYVLTAEEPLNLLLIRVIDEQFTRTPSWIEADDGLAETSGPCG